MIDNTAKIIKHKVGLLNLAEELGNVSKACKVMGLSRDTFYRYKSAVDEGGVEALFDKSRRQRNHKNRVESSIEEAVVSYATEYPGSVVEHMKCPRNWERPRYFQSRSYPLLPIKAAR